MKKEHIIGGVIGIVFIITIGLCMFFSQKVNQNKEYIPTIVRISSFDEKGNAIEADEKIKLEGEDKDRIKEYANQIKDSAQKERYSMIIFSDYYIHVSEHITLRIKSDVKEYVYYIDDTKEGSEKEIVTRAPEGFVEWIMSKVK